MINPVDVDDGREWVCDPPRRKRNREEPEEPGFCDAHGSMMTSMTWAFRITVAVAPLLVAFLGWMVLSFHELKTAVAVQGTKIETMCQQFQQLQQLHQPQEKK